MAAPLPPEAPKPAARSDAVAVISAAGAFRLLLILLAVWTFFEGFALLTGTLGPLSLGGDDRTAEQIIGAQMLMFVPVYGLLAWQRDRYRLLAWIPYAAQLAIIVPTTWGVLFGNRHGILLLVVSASFFAMLFYFWRQSHPLDFFTRDDDGEYDEEDDDDRDDEADDESEEDALGDDGEGEPSKAPRRGVRARDVARRPGRFRRRGG